MIKLAAVACAALLALTACGGGDDATAKDNIKAGLMKQSSGLTGNSKVTDEQAQCVADGLVDDIGTDKLQEYGLLTKDLEVDTNANPTDMSAEDAKTLAQTVVGCVDFKKILTDQLATVNDQLTDEQKQCISDAIDESALVDALASGFQGQTPDFGSGMQGDMMKCMSPTQ